MHSLALLNLKENLNSQFTSHNNWDWSPMVASALWGAENAFLSLFSSSPLRIIGQNHNSDRCIPHAPTGEHYIEIDLSDSVIPVMFISH